MWKKTELLGRDEIIREIQSEATQRELRGDMPDYLLRSRLLHFNVDAPQAVELFDVTLKTILKAGYPDFFTEIEGRFQVTSTVPAHQVALIYRAFGISPTQAQNQKDNFPVDWNKFDFTAFEDLYRQDGNPLWLTLKQIIPIGVKTPAVIGRGENIYTAEEKVKTYIQLAEAFKAGSATQFAQTTTEIASRLSSRLGITRLGAQLGIKLQAPRDLIKTPGPDKAIKGVYEMAIGAYAVALKHPECLHLVESNFQPTQNWALPSSGNAVDQVKEFGRKVQHALTDAQNLGDWMILNALIYDRNTDYNELLNVLRPSRKAEAESTSSTDSFGSLDDIDLRKEVETIIGAYQSRPAQSTQGQKCEVAREILRYLDGNVTWYEVCDSMQANPDWKAPTGLLFSQEKLVDIVKEIETNPVAKEEAHFHNKLAALKNIASKTIIERFESQLRGGDKSSKKLNDLTAKQLKNLLAKDGRSDIEGLSQAIVDHLEEHHKKVLLNKGAGLKMNR